MMAAEIECYVMLADDSPAVIETFWAPLHEQWRAANMPLLRIEKERGQHQFEIVTTVTTPDVLAESLICIRETIEHHAVQNGVLVSFLAKPFADQPSSGMHLHLHLADAEGNNAFHKTDAWMSDDLRFSLGGLLAALPASMPIFFPNAEDYVRLDDADHVPKIASWGMNNRYCALRIPMVPDPYHKWIEHRVPCANANPRHAINAMLDGVLKGLREKIEPPAQEFGKPTMGLLKSLAATTGSEVA